MRAERDRRAAILTAEGTKQSAILTAEGQRQSSILKAEGDAKAAILRADGEAQAIQKVFDAIHKGNPDQKLLAYQYLQTLPKIAEGYVQQAVDHPQRSRRSPQGHRQRAGRQQGRPVQRRLFGPDSDAAAEPAGAGDPRSRLQARTGPRVPATRRPRPAERPRHPRAGASRCDAGMRQHRAGFTRVPTARILEYLSGWFSPAEQFSFAKR